MGVCFIVRFLLVLLHLPTIHTPPFTRAIENECGSNQTKTDDGGCICNAGFYRNPANSQCTEECCYCTPANNQVVKECKMQKLGRDCGSQETGGKCISNTTQEPKSKKTTTSKPTLETTGSTVSKQSDSNKRWPINIGIGSICIGIVIISIIGIYKYCKEKKKKANQAQISSVSSTNNGSSTNDLVKITVLSDAV